MHSEVSEEGIIRALKLKAAEVLPKGSRVALYGSRARGDAREDSDWDVHVLIQGDEELPWSFWDKYAWPLELVGLKLNALVNVRIYSYGGWLRRNFLPFFKNVERDSIVLFQN